MRIVLHAGMHKTGSTAIQQAFCSDPPKGLSLPGGPRLNQSDDVQLLFQTGAALDKFHAARYRHLDSAALGRWRDDLAARWRSALARARTPVFLISAEDLSAPDFGQDALVRLVDFLRATRPEAQIEAIAYVRAPRGFMQSAFQQRVKEEKPAARDLDPASLWPNYRARLEKFDAVLGADAVTLRIFAPTHFPNGDVVADLGSFLEVSTASGNQANDGLSLEAMAVAQARLAGRLPVDFPNRALAERFRALPARSLAGLGTRRFAFSDSLVAPVLTANSHDLDWIESRLGQRLTERAAPPDAIGSADELLTLAIDSRDALAAYVAAQTDHARNTALRVWTSRIARTLIRRDPQRKT
ncbi:hypothetical protein ROE7235_01715 [Roseibaca ekhonensis]|uniref:Uncharacterized protein n=1 Tax=Roseinatronobacter ekhonensis TaxID=254356 RepID=A0A3B0MT03_9RHOB|nr:hypothetical protein [Roseibaca ekhonensis]SUZ31964.1 hypothetical protein ROE7235_01715 [Roseibaca ekhonensis]